MFIINVAKAFFSGKKYPIVKKKKAQNTHLLKGKPV